MDDAKKFACFWTAEWQMKRVRFLVVPLHKIECEAAGLSRDSSKLNCPPMRIHLGSFIIETSDSERFTKYRFLLNADVIRVVIGDLLVRSLKSYLNSKGN